MYVKKNHVPLAEHIVPQGISYPKDISYSRSEYIMRPPQRSQFSIRMLHRLRAAHDMPSARYILRTRYISFADTIYSADAECLGEFPQKRKFSY